jgi:hypothetical protein
MEYKLFDLTTKSVFISRDVILHGDIFSICIHDY